MQTKHEFLRRISAIIAVFFTLAFTGCGQTPESPGSLPVSGVVSETTAQSGQETAGVSESGSFTIHFIDVGQADSTLVTCDGHSMLIDGGNADDSNLVYSVLQRETDGHLDYVVGTHAHEDHIGGLSGAFEADTADVTFCPVTEYDSKAFRNFKARADERGGGITVPAVGDTFTLGEASVTVVAVNSVPEDTNNTSIVIRIVYGDTSFLFTGDAEQETEEKILETGQDIESTVLKVGHHGSSTSTSQAFLDAVSLLMRSYPAARTTATVIRTARHLQSCPARELRCSERTNSVISTAPLTVRKSPSRMGNTTRILIPLLPR